MQSRNRVPRTKLWNPIAGILTQHTIWLWMGENAQNAILSAILMQVECEGVVRAYREKEFDNCSVRSMVPIALLLCHQSSDGHPA